MNNTLLDLSGKIDNAHVAALSLLKRVADSKRIPFFVVGATARDYILAFGHGRTAYRMTMDVDIGIQVADWGQYEKLANALLSPGKFTATRNKHRFRYADAETRATIKSILDRETEDGSQYRLISDMLRGSLSRDEQFDGILQQVEQLKKGFAEISG